MISTDINNDQYYTIEEAAVILKVTVQTVAKYLRKKELKGKKMGPRQKWHVQGKEIFKKMRDWNMLES